MAAVRDVADEDGVALLVTHGGSIRLVRAFIDGSCIQSFHRTSVPNCDLLTVPCHDLAARISAFLPAAGATPKETP